MNAGLIFRWIEDEFGFAVFLGHRVVAVDHNLPIRSVISSNFIAENGVVNYIGYERDRERGKNCDREQSLEERFDLRL